jgi:hypothetical protein
MDKGRNADLYRKGTQDGDTKNWDPPHGVWASADWKLKEVRAYSLGYYYARGQHDGAQNTYSRPSSCYASAELQEIYDKGWKNGRAPNRR